MKFENKMSHSACLSPLSLTSVARTDWKWWLPGALFCFVLASVIITGWPHGLLPNLRTPFIYGDDGLSHAWVVKRIIEGWVFDNARSGYPFGSEFYDYPGSDAGNFLIVKLISLLSGEWQAVFNLYFLLSYAATFACSFLVLRATGLDKPFAMAAALLYSFLPFHMHRMPHLFFTWYFVAPLFYYFALRIADATLFEGKLRSRLGAKLLTAALMVALGSFGVYYALFGVLMFVTVAFASISGRSDFQPFKAAFIASCFVVLGVVLNVAPNLAYRSAQGPNTEVAHRSPAEGEIYGLKMMQLLIPSYTHRNDKLRAAAMSYNSATPLVNENSASSLGVVGSVGFLAMLAVAFAALAGRKMTVRLKLVALLVCVLFMFGTIGGLGSLFSMTISSSIRGWNRISIFIGFGALLGLFLLLQAWLQHRTHGKRLALWGSTAAIVLSAVGVYDQTAPVCTWCNAQIDKTFAMDKQFIGAIEAAVPKGGAIYQLPYMAFPEVPPMMQMTAYDLMPGYLHSDTLHWSYAGMKGRKGDLFYRSLANESVERQLEVIGKLGFDGIYIDRRGYADLGASIIEELTAQTGQGPLLTRSDGQVVFFRLPASAASIDLKGKSTQQIIDAVGYDSKGASRYMTALAGGINFASAELPPFLSSIQGVSGVEGWGRWSDAAMHRSVELNFVEPLRKRFTLLLKLQPFGPNVGQELIVRVGSKDYPVKLLAGGSDYRIVVDLGNEQVSRIELVPPLPTSPRELGKGEDDRKLGIGLYQMQFRF